MLAALAVARALEEGRLQGSLSRGLARVWAGVASRAVVRPLPRPGGVALVAVGGATLGGSGKTPLAIACARQLAETGARVALVGHAYRAKPRHPRVVLPGDALDEVGDEALVAARELSGAGVVVVVGPTRASAVSHAASLAEVLVVDGVVQSRPRASLALLAVNEDQPWGLARSVPPCGDLRAPVAALLSSVDRVVPVGDGSTDARTASRGVQVAEELLPWSALVGLRLGLVLALGRPRRVVDSLARRGLLPTAVVGAADHGAVPVGALRRSPPVDLWIATAKCSLHARPALQAVWPGRPIGVLEHTVSLGPELCGRLRGLACLDPVGCGQ